MGKLTNNVEEATFTHFSHQHPLIELTSNTTTICSGCNLTIAATKPYYTCKTCDISFSLHKPCFDMPTKINHKADPNHELVLISSPSFQCKACGNCGLGFSYCCSICSANYHTLCMRMPLFKTHNAHPHKSLVLEFSPVYGEPKGFRCDICGEPGSDHWLYRCDDCEYDVHINCINAMPKAHQAQVQVQVQEPQNSPMLTNQLAQGQISQNMGNGNYNNPSTTAYVNPSTSSFMQGNPSGGYSNQQGGGYANQQGGGYANQQGGGYVSQQGGGFGGAQAVLGAGMGGLLLTGVVTGMAEGVGQRFVQGVVDNFTHEGSGSSDQNAWN